MLRYLSDAYKALTQTVPEDAKTEELYDLTEWLGELVRQVDSSLLDEWDAAEQPRRRRAARSRPPIADEHAPRRSRPTPGPSGSWSATSCSAGSNWPPCGASTSSANSTATPAGPDNGGSDALAGYFADHADIGTGPDARGPALLMIDTQPGRWVVRQILDDPAGDHDWGISAEVDLAASDAAGTAVVRITAVGQL